MYVSYYGYSYISRCCQLHSTRTSSRSIFFSPPGEGGSKVADLLFVIIDLSIFNIYTVYMP